MKYDPEKHHRRSIRLKGYDYSQPGAYFVTINTIKREHIFGEISDGVMHLNEYGTIVDECWHSIPEHFANVQLDEFVIMPDHVHGIFFIIEDDFVGATHASPPQNGVTDETAASSQPHVPPQNGVTDKTMALSRPHGPKSHSVGSIVGSFKSASTNRANKMCGETGMTLWQRNYHEHIIRDEYELNRIRHYIRNNPANWNRDKE